MPSTRVTLRHADRTSVVEVLDEGRVKVEGNIVAVVREAPGRVRVEQQPGGSAWAISAGDVRWVYHDGCVYAFEVQRGERRQRASSDAATSLAAPMPATVRQVRVAVGDTVSRGDTLIVLEAMKMELPVRANVSGVVTALYCQPGELVQPGRPLIALEAEPEQ